ncbi:hypothetical protein AMS68_002267 [Peltaster fructicola]|uniref:NB-ARC domain-containing protein n=1 Tax=Peltaster fructicola TaxID=286661 RepID=A0A6H0XQJ7_9PEZI|nr:hypothetical protein AMS68_002267 [Peltaster fructicola]
MGDALSSAQEPSLHHSGSGALNTHFGDGVQRNYEQHGTSNRYTNVDTIANYYEAPQREVSPPPTHTVPFIRDEAFIERPELAQLKEKLTRPGARVALHGLGGVGKSQLAIEHCYRLREQEPGTWVFWIHTSNAARFDQDIRKLAEVTRIPGRHDKDANIFQLVYNWLMDGSRKWLVVLDNADDADFLFEAPTSSGANTSPRIEYLPVCDHGSMLITTRRQAVASRLSDKHNIVALQPDQDHAVALLNRLSREHDEEIVRQLAVALEYMPLAIAQAAAYVEKRQPRCSLKDYLSRFEKSNKSRSNLLEVESDELRRDRREAKNAILLTWQISFEHIYATRRTAADLLSLMSFYDYQGIPEVLVKGAMEDPQEITVHGQAGGAHLRESASGPSSDGFMDESFDQDIYTLRDYSFISVTPKGSTFEMHRLVQLAAQLWLKQRPILSWEARSIRTLDAVLPFANYEHWAECRVLYPHAKLVMQSRIGERNALLPLSSVLYKAASFASSQGLYAEAEAAARHCWRIREEILTEEDADTYNRSSVLGLVLMINKYDEERGAWCRRMLEEYEKVFGKEHPDTLKNIHDLALVLQCQGKQEEAEVMHRQALEGREKVLGKEHPDTLTSIHDLALVLQRQGKQEEAEAMQRRALEEREKVLGKEHPDTLASVHNLAYMLHHQRKYEEGKYEEAEELNRRVLEDLRMCLAKGIQTRQ